MGSKNGRIRSVITGVGPLCSLGSGKDVVWEKISSPESDFSPSKLYFDNRQNKFIYLYKIKDFDINKYNIDKNVLSEIRQWKNEEDEDLNLFLATVKLALVDSGLEAQSSDRVGLILAHESPGLESFYLDFLEKSFKILNKIKKNNFQDFFNKMYRSFSKKAYDLQTFMYLHHVAKAFNVHGYSLFINNACSSGLYALEAADQAIKSGLADRMIISAVDIPNIFRCLWLKEKGLYSKDGVIRPFDFKRNGFVCGQAGAAIIMESSEKAEKRNARIYAEYAGGGFRLESWKVTLPNIKHNYYSDAIKIALSKSNLSNANIDLINVHGVATRINDQFEFNSLQESFSRHCERIFINAFKPFFGHSLGACALIETIILLISMRNNTVLPTPNITRIDDKFRMNLVKDSTIKTRINNAIKLSCGFGGYTSAVVLRKL